ncbi:MAG: hypothetical protein AAFP86_22815, partial [Planctomycetota bacterium]
MMRRPKWIASALAAGACVAPLYAQGAGTSGGSKGEPDAAPGSDAATPGPAVADDMARVGRSRRQAFEEVRARVTTTRDDTGVLIDRGASD